MRVALVHIQIEPTDEHEGSIVITFNAQTGQWTFTEGAAMYPRYLKLMTIVTDYLKANEPPAPRGGGQ